MNTDSSYTLGHEEGPLACLRYRSVDRSCAFFRDHVRAESHILDCGCGPGSITVGLAQWAPDGETIGIDIGAAPIEGARALAQALGVRNVTFRQADIFDLPFQDNTFDIVFSQTVLFHIPNREKAVAEIKRVVRPGGLVALRDVINASIMIWPDDPLVREIPRLVRLGAQRSGGDPDIGQKLGTLLHAAGFEDVFFTLGFDQPERPEERAQYFSVFARRVEGDLANLAVSEGWTTAERLAQGSARLRNLAMTPGAIFAIPFGQALGRKPS